jgi:hypothetical protein
VAQPDHLNIVLAFVMLARSVSLLDFLNRKWKQAYQITMLCVCACACVRFPFKSYQMTDFFFHEIWHKKYATGKHPKVVAFKPMNQWYNTASARSCEAGTLAPLLQDNEIHLLTHPFLHTTGPYPLPKPVRHSVRPSASFFNFQYPLFSLKSSSSCLRLLCRLTYPSLQLSFHNIFQKEVLSPFSKIKEISVSRCTFEVLEESHKTMRPQVHMHSRNKRV